MNSLYTTLPLHESVAYPPRSPDRRSRRRKDQSYDDVFALGNGTIQFKPNIHAITRRTVVAPNAARLEAPRRCVATGAVASRGSALCFAAKSDCRIAMRCAVMKVLQRRRVWLPRKIGLQPRWPVISAPHPAAAKSRLRARARIVPGAQITTTPVAGSLDAARGSPPASPGATQRSSGAPRPGT